MSTPEHGNTPAQGSRVEWVATPPGGPRTRRRASRPEPYTGPPVYPAVPRWGFPPLGWRWPLALPAHPQADPVQRVAAWAGTAASTLWLTAGMSAVAAGAEVWRYVLLLLSRDRALSKFALDVSDALVITAGTLSWLLGAASLVFSVLWLLWARTASAEQIGVRQRRPDWQVVAGVLVPGANLAIPGSALAEVEHAVLVAGGDQELAGRPRPSRLVLAWWAAWAVSVVLGWTTLLWSFRDGVQALADGVVLHFWTDVAAVVAAVLTMRVINYLSTLIVPADPTELAHLQVVDVRGAPAPQRAERPPTAAR